VGTDPRMKAKQKIPVDVVVHTQALIAESPMWDERTGLLHWVDILRGELHRTDPDSGDDRVRRLGTAVGAAAFREAGGLVVAVADGFCEIDGDDEEEIKRIWRMPTGSSEVSSEVSTWPNGYGLRMNDGKCDPAGRFWAGTMSVARTPGAGRLYRLGTDYAVTEVLSDVTLSNGLAWSPDAATMYYIDTARRSIDGFDFDLDVGSVRRRRSIVECEEGAGNPDGLTIDSDGCIWVAMAHGSAVRRYTPQGRLDRVVPMPVRKVTSCIFGGSDLGTLFVTSACVGLSETEMVEEPLAGAVLCCEVGAAGLPAHRFAGDR